MSDIVLDVEKRELNEKIFSLRKQGIVPAVVYGHNKDNVHIKFVEKEFNTKLKGNMASNVFIDLSVGKGPAEKTVYIKEVQKDVISKQIQHVDFVEINPDEKIHISVPVKLKGTAVGIVEGGVLEFMLRSIEVSCLPKNTPREISVDISNLHAGESIHVETIIVGEEVKIITAKDSTIVAIVAAKKEKEEKTEETVSEEAK